MKYLIAAVLIVAVMNVSADVFISGHELKKWCDTPESKHLYQRCGGYIVGVNDLGTSASFFCLPPEVTQSYVRVIVRNWLDENPEKLDFTASYLVRSALKEAYPCPVG
jgi:hypothetical protein